jgi:hypothetical protein
MLTTDEKAARQSGSSVHSASPATRPRRRRSRAARTPEVVDIREAPPITTVFREAAGGIHHGRCGRLLDFHGRRAALELDFYCTGCLEHVTLPEMVVNRIPVVEQRDTRRGFENFKYLTE